jgi:hypothetical protein
MTSQIRTVIIDIDNKQISLELSTSTTLQELEDYMKGQDFRNEMIT